MATSQGVLGMRLRTARTRSEKLIETLVDVETDVEALTMLLDQVRAELAYQDETRPEGCRPPPGPSSLDRLEELTRVIAKLPAVVGLVKIEAARIRDGMGSI